MIKKCDLYPWLSDSEILENEKFNSSYNVDSTVKESDIILNKKLNDEADILTPVLSTGWPISDVDSINEVQDARLQNILIARLQPQGSDIPNNYTDEQLLDMVIRRNLTSQEVSEMANEYNYLSEESARLASEIQSQQTINPSTDE